MSNVTFASSKKSEQIVNLLKGKTPPKIYIHGAIGTGKTHIVKTIAKEQGYKIIDINSTTIRNKEELEKIHEQVQSESFEKIIYLFVKLNYFGNNFFNYFSLAFLFSFNSV